MMISKTFSVATAIAAAAITMMALFSPTSFAQRQKILVLHGAGQSPEGFRNSEGMVDLEAALSEFEFVYARGGFPVVNGDKDKEKDDWWFGSKDETKDEDVFPLTETKDEDGSPLTETETKDEDVFPMTEAKDEFSMKETGNLWIPDPPNKDDPTTSPTIADASLATLDYLLERDGPFFGILGYSQGAAFVPVYLAHAPEGAFQTALLFCGYRPETHLGLLDLVSDKSPFGDIPALVWMGNRDYVIPPSFSTDLIPWFTNPTIVTSPIGGHDVPGTSDGTFEEVVAFVRDKNSNNNNGGGDIGKDINTDTDSVVDTDTAVAVMASSVVSWVLFSVLSAGIVAALI